MEVFLNRSNIYDDLQSVVSISDWMAGNIGELVLDATVSTIGCVEFFRLLEKFELSRAGKRIMTANIQAKSLTILLPQSLQDIRGFVKEVMKEVFGKEAALPYAAWLVKKGAGRYVHILISERYYSSEEVEYVDYWKTARFQNRTTGKLCKATDPEAKQIVSPGDVRKTWKSHFSLKSRLFSADGFARKNRDRKKRIGFDRLLNHIRQCIVAALVKMKISFSKSFSIPRLKRHSWLNKYQNINLTRINTAIRHIEREIQQGWIAVRDGYFYQDLKTYDRFMTLSKKYLNRMKKGFYTKVLSGNRKLKLSFSIFMNVVRVQENLDSLIEDFDTEMNEFLMKYICGI
ncbi:hypothetical protein [Bulleidia sp. zg-1006]|uniref:hypothetical protein n=1 Tax=Bulleidia sp. zg-1006 TaxID=2806552 RepID=UPI00193A70AF|nr:hypothetical protein [Bulleidia sp. zg-1006]QRG86918.1 hypothetical protein JOS54_00965 [Bulleidia sp. zg-1006]